MRGYARKRVLGAGFVAIGLAGCGGSDSGSDRLANFDCAIVVALSGAVDHEIPAEDLACAYPVVFDSGTTTLLIPLDGPVESISFEVAEITREAVGEFPLTLVIRLETGETFTATDCTAQVDVHEPAEYDSELGDAYVLRGSGRCAAPASSSDGETIEIGDFDFAASVVWGG